MASTPPKRTLILPSITTPPVEDTTPIVNPANQHPSAPDESLLCPSCHAPYAPDAPVCSQCGRVFVPTDDTLSTVPSDASQPPTNPLWGNAFPVRGNAIATYTLVLIIGEQQLALPQAPTVILGRGPTAEDGRLVVDLTPFDARINGVSRRHVQVTHTAPLTYVSDLNSTNGTWLNGTRLLASAARVLRSGDELYLGQLRIVVRFR